MKLQNKLTIALQLTLAVTALFISACSKSDDNNGSQEGALPKKITFTDDKGTEVHQYTYENGKLKTHSYDDVNEVYHYTGNLITGITETRPEGTINKHFEYENGYLKHYSDDNLATGSGYTEIGDTSSKTIIITTHTATTSYNYTYNNGQLQSWEEIETKVVSETRNGVHSKRTEINKTTSTLTYNTPTDISLKIETTGQHTSTTYKHFIFDTNGNLLREENLENGAVDYYEVYTYSNLINPTYRKEIELAYPHIIFENYDLYIAVNIPLTFKGYKGEKLIYDSKNEPTTDSKGRVIKLVRNGRSFNEDKNQWNPDKSNMTFEY